MARYRIVKRPSLYRRNTFVYDVEKRVLWLWRRVETAFLSLEAAELKVEEIRSYEPAKREVVREYD